MEERKTAVGYRELSARSSPPHAVTTLWRGIWKIIAGLVWHIVIYATAGERTAKKIKGHQFTFFAGSLFFLQSAYFFFLFSLCPCHSDSLSVMFNLSLFPFFPLSALICVSCHVIWPVSHVFTDQSRLTVPYLCFISVFSLCARCRDRLICGG